MNTTIKTLEQIEKEATELKTGVFLVLLDALDKNSDFLETENSNTNYSFVSANGDYIRVESAAIDSYESEGEDDEIYVNGYVVEDPEDQAFDGEPVMLERSELMDLPLETLIEIVKHLTQNQ